MRPPAGLGGLCNLRDLGGRANDRSKAEEDSGWERHDSVLLVEHVMPREQQDVEENH